MNDSVSAQPAAERMEELRRRYLEVDSSNVADVLDDMGLLDQALATDLAPRLAEAGRLAGWAYTLRGEMATYPLEQKDPVKMEVLSGVPEGSVTVWSGEGEGVCYFGELIAIGMKERGCVGALVDGGVRDLRWIGDLGFPVYGRYRSPVQSIGRWKVVEGQVPVPMPGATTTSVTVRPGDFILGDVDGVVVIPQEVAEDVVDRAEQLGRREVEIREALAGGMSLPQALAKFGHV